LDLDRAHWKGRVQDVLRQLGSVEEDVASLEQSGDAHLRRAAQAERRGDEVESALPALRDRVTAARASLDQAEAESPDEAAELAETARRLVAPDQARGDAPLKISTLQGPPCLHK